MLSAKIMRRSIAAAFKLQGKTTFAGLKIAIENKKGSIRKGVEPSGKPWSIKMPYDYGYVMGTKGVDGDEVDVFLGPNEKANYVYIVHQSKTEADSSYDEDKVMLGFPSANAAKKAYQSAYNNVDLFHSMTVMPLDCFKEKMLAPKVGKLHAGGPGSGRHSDFMSKKQLASVEIANKHRLFFLREDKKAGLIYTRKVWRKGKDPSEDTPDLDTHLQIAKNGSYRLGTQHNGKFFRVDEGLNAKYLDMQLKEHIPLDLQDIKAGGPGSGRHKEFGIQIKPKKKRLPTEEDIAHKEAMLEHQREVANKAREAMRKEGKSARGKPIVSEKAKRALANANVATKAHHDLAEKTEEKVNKALKGSTKSKDNAPFDIIYTDSKGKQHGIEVKALMTQKNDKITQKGDAIQRKVDFAKKNKLKGMHTVAIDSRLSTTHPDVYHRAGVGSFRLGSMTKVPGGFKGLAAIFK